MATSLPRIFVQIPAYRDAELGATLRDLARTATHPERLRVVVLWQRGDTEPGLGDLSGLPRLTILEVPAAQSRGPNWARRLIQEHRGDEEFTLVLDSHMRFVEGWDDAALSWLAGLSRTVEKPVLTGYLPAYVPGAPGARRTDPYKIYPHARQDGVLTRLISHPVMAWRDRSAPLPAEYLSLHFLLADSSFDREVPHDPDIYFFGDEVALSARAFTHGWDLFHPHRVLGWHAYSRSSRVAHWDDHRSWSTAHARTLSRLRALFREDDALAGLRGTARSMRDYERHIMTDLVVP